MLGANLEQEVWAVQGAATQVTVPRPYRWTITAASHPLPPMRSKPASRSIRLLCGSADRLALVTARCVVLAVRRSRGRDRRGARGRGGRHFEVIEITTIKEKMLKEKVPGAKKGSSKRKTEDPAKAAEETAETQAQREADAEEEAGGCQDSMVAVRMVLRICHCTNSLEEGCM